MEPNNQNLPPVSPNTQVPSTPIPPKPPLPPKPPIPPSPPVAGNMDQVNYADPDLVNRQNKKIVKAVIAVMIVVALVGIIYMLVTRKGSSNVKVSGNQVKFQWQDTEITAQMAPRETIAFVTNGGQTESSDAGLFGVIPSTKVRYLEQKYTDIIHCGSAGAEEVKSNEFSAYFIANDSNTKSSLQNLDKLMKKGNWVEFEIEGQPISQMQANQNGRNVTIMSQSNLVFYLVDNLRIVRENYQ